MEATHLWVKGKGGRAQLPSAPPTQRLPGPPHPPDGVVLGKALRAPHAAGPLPLLGLSVVTEAWQVEVGEFGLRVEKTAKAREADSRGGRKTHSLAAAWAQGEESLKGAERQRRWSGHGGRGNWETVALQQVAVWGAGGPVWGGDGD